jgi:hypothetical protein
VRQLVVSNRTQKQLLLKIAASVPDIKLYRSRPLADQVKLSPAWHWPGMALARHGTGPTCSRPSLWPTR